MTMLAPYSIEGLLSDLVSLISFGESYRSSSASLESYDGISTTDICLCQHLFARKKEIKPGKL